MSPEHAGVLQQYHPTSPWFRDFTGTAPALNTWGMSWNTWATRSAGPPAGAALAAGAGAAAAFGEALGSARFCPAAAARRPCGCGAGDLTVSRN